MEKHEIREEFREYAWALKGGAGFLQAQMEGKNFLEGSNNMQKIEKSGCVLFAEFDFGTNPHGCCELLCCYLSSWF